MQWLYNLFNWVLGGLGSMWAGFAAWLNGLWNLAGSHFKEFIQQCWLNLRDLLPNQIKTYFDVELIGGASQVGSDVFEFAKDLTWFFPVAPVFTLVATAYGLCGVIRMVRWAKSFIPTIGD